MRADQAAKTPVVMVETVAQSDLADQMSYPARVSSKVKADIYAPTDGVVTAIATPLGSSVKANTVLLQLRNLDPVYQYVPVPVDTPVGGVVSTVHVTAGTKVTKGQILVTVIDPQQLLVTVEVPAAEAPAFHAGLAGHLSLPMLKAAGAQSLVVSGVSPLVDPATGTATVELALQSPPKGRQAIPPGAIGKVSFRINKRRGLQVPDQAIVYRGKETLIRAVAGGHAKFVPVTVGTTRHGLTEITSGLTVGTQIVTRASAYIADGQEVSVQQPETATR